MQDDEQVLQLLRASPCSGNVNIFKVVILQLETALGIHFHFQTFLFNAPYICNI